MARPIAHFRPASGVCELPRGHGLGVVGQASSSYARSSESEIEEHFGFELWVTVGLFLFVAAMAIADWLF